MIMCVRLFILVLFSSVFLMSCQDVEKENKEDSGNIHTIYTIWGEEGKEWVTAVFQFLQGGANGPAMILEKPSKIYLDDILLAPDSARETGVFYERQVLAAGFAGRHTIRFIDQNNKEHKEEFSFLPFRLRNNLPDVLRREDLILELAGLKDGEVPRVVMMDTAFDGEGVNERDTVNNNLLDLRKFAKALVNGPITLHLYKEVDQPRHKKSYGTGTISITYALKREFELKD